MVSLQKEQTLCVSETGTVRYVLKVFSILAHSPTEVKSAEDLSPGLDCQLVLVAPGTLKLGMLADTVVATLRMYAIARGASYGLDSQQILVALCLARVGSLGRECHPILMAPRTLKLEVTPSL